MINTGLTLRSLIFALTITLAITGASLASAILSMVVVAASYSASEFLKKHDTYSDVAIGLKLGSLLGVVSTFSIHLGADKQIVLQTILVVLGLLIVLWINLGVKRF